jgi:HK97 family phage prohead protease
LLYLSTPLELVEIKADSSGAMEFSAYASTFNNKDHGGDVITKGAFSASLAERKFRPLLWQHDMREPIGIEKSLKEDGRGLLGTWELVDTQRGREAYKLLKAGAVRSMSIGYVPVEFKFDDAGDTRILNRIDLLENSVVSLPMNEQAQVQSVKHVHCATCMALVETPKKEEEPPTETEDKYGDMTLAQLAGAVSEVVAAFGERARGFLDKLSASDLDLTESKRTDLQALLETFSGIDAVRHDAEAVLAHKQHQVPDPTTSQISATALALELARHRLRARGVEV